jgi:hypothetical protein
MWWWAEFTSYGETLVVTLSRKAMRLPELIMASQRTSPHATLVPLARVARISYPPAHRTRCRFVTRSSLYRLTHNIYSPTVFLYNLEHMLRSEKLAHNQCRGVHCTLMLCWRDPTVIKLQDSEVGPELLNLVTSIAPYSTGSSRFGLRRRRI